MKKSKCIHVFTLPLLYHIESIPIIQFLLRKELSSPTAAYLVEMARLFHTTTDDILGLTTEEQISLRGMTEQEKRLVYNLIDYISERNKP